MCTVYFADVTYRTLCTNIGEPGRKWWDKQKNVVWCRIICSEYTTKNKLIVLTTLIEDTSSYCSKIKRFSSRKKLVVHKRSRIVICWSWMYLFDLRTAFRFLPKERRDQRSKTYMHFWICTKLNSVRIYYTVLSR